MESENSHFFIFEDRRNVFKFFIFVLCQDMPNDLVIATLEVVASGMNQASFIASLIS